VESNAVTEKVLDHGFIRLVDFMGSDLSISRSARVSYDAEPREEDKGLINYMMKHNHSTPFESVTFTFEVKAPIFVFRQWHRHRTQSYNELSARYRPLPSEYYVPELSTITTQDPKNKQARTTEQHPDAAQIQADIDIFCEAAHVLYQQLLDKGCPRELARGVLPLNTYSHMFTTMNLLNCFKFIRLRNAPDAQYEIRVYAAAMLDIIEPLVPIAVQAFKDTLPTES